MELKPRKERKGKKAKDGETQRDPVQTLSQSDRITQHLSWSPPQPKWIVGVESYLKTFGLGRFNTRGLFSLAEVNALVNYVAACVFECVPWSVHPNIPRFLYGLKKHGGTELTVKDAVFDFVRTLVPESFAWRRDAKGLIHKSNQDQSDAHLLALATLHLNSLESLKQSPSEFRQFQAVVGELLIKRSSKQRTLGEEEQKQLYYKYLDKLPPPTPQKATTYCANNNVRVPHST